MYGIIPQKPDNIPSDYDCGYGWTISMFLAHRGVIPSQEWYHNPLLKNYNGETVALLLAGNGITPPEEW